MRKIKILHTADIHIGAAENFLGDSAKTRRFENLITFEKIMELGLERQVDVVAIAGDLFDNNSIEDRFIEAVISKIAEISPIKVIYAAGNHDPLDSSSPFLNREIPQNLYVLGAEDECIEFPELELRVYGRSFSAPHLNGEDAFTIPAKDDTVNLMVQHGELKSDLNSDYNAITPKFVKNSGMDYIALGHVHKHSDIAKMGNTFFGYCGCPEGQGFDELDAKGVYIGEIGKGFCELEFVAVSKRQHIHEKIDITGIDESNLYGHIISKLEELHGEDFAKNLYKIELTGELPPESNFETAELQSRLSDTLYFVKLKDSTELLVDTEALSKEISLKGIFVKKMLEREKNAPEETKELYRKALKTGLKAFYSEVKYDEN